MLRSWPGKVKCLTSFLWLSNGYWRRSHFYQHAGHYINHTQVNILHIYFAIDVMEDFNMHSVWLFLKDVIDATCLQQSVLVLAKHLPLSLLLNLITFLLCSIVLLPIICLRLVLLLKAISGDDWNISLNSGLTCKTCQCFSTIDLMLVKVRLYMIVIGILRFTSCEVLFSRSILSSFLSLSICSLSVVW